MLAPLTGEACGDFYKQHVQCSGALAACGRFLSLHAVLEMHDGMLPCKLPGISAVLLGNTA